MDVPIDKEAITKKIGTEKMFLTMLSRFEKISLEPALRGLKEVLDNPELTESQRAKSFKFKCH